MLQHVSIEVLPADVPRTVEFWALLDFAEVEAPEALGGNVTWVERQGTQVHLIHTEGATVPVLGHAAVVVADFDSTLEALAESGFAVSENRQLWGERRAFANAPGGHKVELMASPPPAAG